MVEREKFVMYILLPFLKIDIAKILLFGILHYAGTTCLH